VRSHVTRRELIQAAVLFVVAAALRAWLSARYFGWEEGDYGNVMHIREVLDSGFSWFRPAHMPGWYVLAAVLSLGLPTLRLAGLVLTLVASAASVAGAAWATRRLVGAQAAWLVGAWLAVQPEMFLYGSSTLRSPVYTALAVGSFCAFLAGRERSGIVLVAVAFLVRMEAFFAFFGPAAWSVLRGARRPGAVLAAAGALLGVVAAWQLYVTVGQDEGVFFLGPMGINTAGSTVEEEPFQFGPWLNEGLHTSWWFVSWLLPRKLGWTWMLLAAGGAVRLWRDGGPGRQAVVWAAFPLLFWLGEGLLSQQDPNHNLYWVWMLPIVPFLGVLAGAGYAAVDERLRDLPRLVRRVVFGAVLLSALPSFHAEGSYQMDRADRWYRPQLEVSRWLEESAAKGSGVLVSSIPEVWLKRKPNDLRVHAWWLLPGHLDGESPEEFATFLNTERIDYVLWFAEEWTDSNRIAPWLRTDEPMQVGPVGLSPVDREPGYGWILYVVTRPGAPVPAIPPPFGQGAPGRGWAP